MNSDPMKKNFARRTPFYFLIASLWLGATGALSQKGVGETTGIAQSNQSVNLESVSGTVLEMKNGPCENTSGKSIEGAHLILSTDSSDVLNLHLGPADARVIKNLLSQVKIGSKIEAVTFRTTRLPSGQWIAKSVRVEGMDSIVLRDEDLRPTWQVRKAKGRSSRARGLGPCF